MEKSDYALLEELYKREQRVSGNNGSFKIRDQAIVTENRDDRVEKPVSSIFTGPLTNRRVWKFSNLSELACYRLSRFQCVGQNQSISLLGRTSSIPLWLNQSFLLYWVEPVPYLEVLGRNQ